MKKAWKNQSITIRMVVVALPLSPHINLDIRVKVSNCSCHVVLS